LSIFIHNIIIIIPAIDTLSCSLYFVFDRTYDQVYEKRKVLSLIEIIRISKANSIVSTHLKEYLATSNAKHNRNVITIRLIIHIWCHCPN